MKKTKAGPRHGGQAFTPLKSASFRMTLHWGGWDCGGVKPQDDRHFWETHGYAIVDRMARRGAGLLEIMCV